MSGEGCKRDEFSAERRAQIIEALSWWEDDSGRWGHDKAANVLHAHEVEWCGVADGPDAAAVYAAEADR